MTHQMQTTALDEIGELLAEHGFDGLARRPDRVLLNEVMKLERAAALGAGPYQRSEDRKGHANGFKPKTVQTRVGSPHPGRPADPGRRVLPLGPGEGAPQRAGAEAGVGRDVRPGRLDPEGRRHHREALRPGGHHRPGQPGRRRPWMTSWSKWRSRPLGETPYLILDARYEKVRHGGQVRSCAVLVAIGIDPQGKRSVLGVSVSLSEAEVHWRDFLASLAARGLHGVKLVVSDAHGGLKPALDARLTGVPWQRCQFHLMKNALGLRAPVRDAGRGGGRPAGGLRRPRPPRGRASTGAGGGEVPHDGPQAGRIGWRRTCPRGWRSSPCPGRTGDGCGRRTCWSG